MSDPAELWTGASYWVTDADVSVTVFNPRIDRVLWALYLDGLVTVYAGLGVAEIVDRPALERRPCQLAWLARDRAGQAVGGIRVEGPFNSASDLPGLAEMSDSSDAPRLPGFLQPFADDGIIEFKGAWAAEGRGGVGPVLARCMSHSLWWFDVPHALCISAVHSLDRWRSAGAEPIEGVAPARYPNDRYRSVPLLWGKDHQARLATELVPDIWFERRCLRPLRDRLENRVGGQQWHPEVLLETDRRVAELRACGVCFIDGIEALRAELADLMPPVEDRLIAEPGRWVYLPWRNTAIHLLGPESYRRVRTDRNRHKLLGAELEAMRSRTVGVVGLSVGHSAAFVLAMEGLCGRLRLSDHDELELSNLNRLPASILDLGSPKTHLTARRIAELDPYLEVELFHEGVHERNCAAFVHGLDVVVEECDSIEAKLLVRSAAADAGVAVIMETSDRGLLDVERFDLEPNRLPFHGLLVDLDATELADLSTDAKVPYVLSILDAEELSAVMAASMIEIDQTTRSWPQLASDVALGSSLVATAVRRLFTTGRLASGRTRLDLGELMESLAEPDRSDPNKAKKPPPLLQVRPPLANELNTALVQAAELAPSGGNMQPWRFEQDEERFEIFSDDSKRVGLDIGGRGTAVACGAALANVAAVAAARGKLAADGPMFCLGLDERSDHMGTVLLGDATDPEWAGLADQVPRRVTNRQLGRAEPLTDRQLHRLQTATEQQAGARLHYLATEKLGDLIEIWAESDRIRQLTSRLHGELMSELRRPGVDRVDDGLDQRTLEFSAADLAKLPVLRRPDVMAQLNRWDGGGRLGDDSRKRLRAGSGLVVVSIRGESRSHYVRGGIALERLWLTASAMGLGFQPMSPVFGYANSQSELAEVIGPERAEALFPLGRRAFELLGMAPSQRFVLAARIHKGPNPSGISRRRSHRPSQGT